MTIDPKTQQRLSAFTRWWAGQRARLGAALDSHTTELKATAPTKPATTARHKRALKEEEVIRVPAGDAEAEEAMIVGEVLQDAWRQGEACISLSTLRGRKISPEDDDRFKRARYVKPGPDPYAPVVTVHEDDVYKPERTLYMVVYKVDGFEGEHSAGPYLTEEIAGEHAADIRAFEGVTTCYVVPLTAEEPST